MTKQKRINIYKYGFIIYLFFLIFVKVDAYPMELNTINHIYNEEKYKSYFFNKDGKLIYIYEYHGDATQDKEYGYCLVKDDKGKEIELCIYNQIDDDYYEYEIFDTDLIKKSIKFRNNKIYEIFRINNNYILLLDDKIVVKYIDKPNEDVINDCNSIGFNKGEIIVFNKENLFGDGPDDKYLIDYSIYNSNFEFIRKGEGTFLIGKEIIELSTYSNLINDGKTNIIEDSSIKNEWNFEKVKIHWIDSAYYAEFEQGGYKELKRYLGIDIKDVIEYRDKKTNKKVYLVKETNGHSVMYPENFLSAIDFGNGTSKSVIMNFDALEDGYIITGKDNGMYYHNSLYDFEIERLKILDGPFTSISTIHINNDKYYYALAHRGTVSDNTLYDKDFNIVNDLGDIYDLADVENIFNYKGLSSFYAIKKDGKVSILQLNNTFKITKKITYDDYQLYVNDNKDIGNNKLLFGINDDGLRIKMDLLDDNLNIVLSGIVDFIILDNNTDYFEFYTEESFGYMDYDGNILLSYDY